MCGLITFRLKNYEIRNDVVFAWSNNDVEWGDAISIKCKALQIYTILFSYLPFIINYSAEDIYKLISASWFKSNNNLTFHSQYKSVYVVSIRWPSIKLHVQLQSSSKTLLSSTSIMMIWCENGHNFDTYIHWQI